MDAKKTASRMREGFEQQRKAGVNVDWFTWQIAWNDAFFDQRDAAQAPSGERSAEGLKILENLWKDPNGLMLRGQWQAREAAPVAPAAAASTLLGSPAEGHWGEPETPSDGHRLESDVDEEAQPDEHAGLPSRDDGRETVDDVLAIVRSYGPYGRDINEALRFQIVLADEILCLRALYLSAIKGRRDFRNALREARAASPASTGASDAGA